MHVQHNEATVSIHKLIYIGEAEDVRDRVAIHENYRDWLRHVRRGNELCFSFGWVWGDGAGGPSQ